jgi:hypothetical protein
MELHLGYLQPNELLWTHSCFFFYSLVRDESITAFPLFCFFFFFFVYLFTYLSYQVYDEEVFSLVEFSRESGFLPFH